MIEIKVNNKKYNSKKDVNLGEFLRNSGFDKMPCGGHGKCGKCKVYATGNISPPTDTELSHLTPSELEKGIRLACFVTVFGSCEVEFIKSDNSGLIFTDGEMPEFDLSPMFSEYGAAIDIGTTTVAARIYNTDGKIIYENSCYNSQKSFGADVISRIESALAGKGKQLADAVRSDINRLISESADKSGIKSDKIDFLVITGNTVMLYLLTETSPEPLSHAPFNADRLFGETLSAKDLGLSAISPDTKVYLPPCISAFVGADITTAILASDMMKLKGTNLLADIGTNGEIALLHNGVLSVSSTAAGPAFEGAGIKMGMAGTTGAIHRVTHTGNSFHSDVIGNTAPAGICGSGLIDAVACLIDSELMDETGFLEEDPITISAPVVLTGQDIRALQLAKSAICAGIETILELVGTESDRLSSLIISGGFGSYLNLDSAAKIGLFPKTLRNRTRVIGNGALAGASMLLLNGEFIKTCADFINKAEVAELASNPVFSEKYIDNMYFNNKKT